MAPSELIPHRPTKDQSDSTMKIELQSFSIFQNLNIQLTGKNQPISEYLMVMEEWIVLIFYETISILLSPDNAGIQ